MFHYRAGVGRFHLFQGTDFDGGDIHEYLPAVHVRDEPVEGLRQCPGRNAQDGCVRAVKRACERVVRQRQIDAGYRMPRLAPSFAQHRPHASSGAYKRNTVCSSHDCRHVRRQ